MNEVSLRSLRDLLKQRPQGLTFADLPSTVLEDLALGWGGGKPLAEAAAKLASRVDGIPARGRDREIAGRAVFTTVRSRNTIRVPSDMTARTSHLRGSLAAVSVTGSPVSAAVTWVVMSAPLNLWTEWSINGSGNYGPVGSEMSRDFFTDPSNIRANLVRSIP